MIDRQVEEKPKLRRELFRIIEAKPTRYLQACKLVVHDPNGCAMAIGKRQDLAKRCRRKLTDIRRGSLRDRWLEVAGRGRRHGLPG